MGITQKEGTGSRIDILGKKGPWEKGWDEREWGMGMTKVIYMYETVN